MVNADCGDGSGITLSSNKFYLPYIAARTEKFYVFNLPIDIFYGSVSDCAVTSCSIKTDSGAGCSSGDAPYTGTNLEVTNEGIVTAKVNDSAGWEESVCLGCDTA